MTHPKVSCSDPLANAASFLKLQRQIDGELFEGYLSNDSIEEKLPQIVRLGKKMRDEWDFWIDQPKLNQDYEPIVSEEEIPTEHHDDQLILFVADAATPSARIAHYLSHIINANLMAEKIAYRHELIRNEKYTTPYDFNAPPKAHFLIGGHGVVSLISNDTPTQSIDGQTALQNWFQKYTTNIGRNIKRVVLVGFANNLDSPFVLSQMHYALQHSDVFVPVLIGFQSSDNVPETPLADTTYRAIVKAIAEKSKNPQNDVYFINPTLGPSILDKVDFLKSSPMSLIIGELIYLKSRFSGTVKKFLDLYAKTKTLTYRAIDHLAPIAEIAARSLKSGGRIFYVSHHTRGILGLMNATDTFQQFGKDYIRGYVVDGWRTMGLLEDQMEEIDIHMEKQNDDRFNISDDHFLENVKLTKDDMIIIATTDLEAEYKYWMDSFIERMLKITENVSVLQIISTKEVYEEEDPQEVLGDDWGRGDFARIDLPHFTPLPQSQSDFALLLCLQNISAYAISKAQQ